MKGKTLKSILLAGIIVILLACGTHKKNKTTTVTPAPTSTVTKSEPTYNFPAPKSTHGVYPPGNEELVAIQKIDKNVTMDILNQGFYVYSVGKCINCHGSKSIYSRKEELWKDIIDDMAIKAKISDAERDAVYKYVLSIKATQPK